MPGRGGDDVAVQLPRFAWFGFGGPAGALFGVIACFAQTSGILECGFSTALMRFDVIAMSDRGITPRRTADSVSKAGHSGHTGWEAPGFGFRRCQCTGVGVGIQAAELQRSLCVVYPLPRESGGDRTVARDVSRFGTAA